MVSNIEELQKDKDFSITKLCETLSISEATARNWIKADKIKPTYTKNSIVYFSKNYVESFLSQIKFSSSNLLKSRRNKKHISGSFLYKDYISSSSKNINVISAILDYIETEKLHFSEQEIKYIVADCAIQLLQHKSKISQIHESFLIGYLNNTISAGKFDKLIDDLIDNKNNAIKFIKKYPELFNNRYVYEKGEDILGLLYISLSNLGNRKATGSYYTPNKIVQKIINNLDFYNSRNKKIIDPGCGSGNFLLHLPNDLIIDNIYGNDIDNTAIKIARLNMALKFEISDIDILYKNFTNKDFLSDNFNEKYDYIIGNPPWGAEFSKEISIKLREKYQATDNKNIESYDVFIEKSLKILTKNGYLSFVLPEAIMSVKSHETIRNIIMRDNSITYLEFLGNIFDKVQCPSIILQLKRTMSPMSCVGMRVVNKNKKFVINAQRTINSDVFNFNMDDSEYFIYNKIIDKQNKIYLKNNAIFALGLVTGDNKKYISNIKTNNNEIVLKGSDIEKYSINKPNTYIEYIPEDFQQVAPTQYYRAKEKLFYKFISNKLVFAYDNKQLLSLNSCNILIPQLDGYDMKYIMTVLNSRIAQFIFKKTYNSIKVLRSHIESIPIPACNREKQSEIIKIVDTIVDNKNSYSELYETIEEKICKLYNISEEEYKIINKP